MAPAKATDPPAPASGKIHGEDFSVEKAKVENGILTLRQSKDFFPDRAVMIFLFLKKGERVQGRSFNIARDQTAGSPHIHMKWKPEGKDVPETETFVKNYFMRLTFGKR